MFRYIFLGLLVFSPTVLYGTPEWVCQDPKGCPIVNNECPTCTLKTPEKPQTIITNTIIKREVVREVTNNIIREVAVPTEVIVTPMIPPVISFTNPKVQLAEISRNGREWRWSAKVANFTCVGTRVSLPLFTPVRHSGTFRCNGENTSYNITFF